MEQDKEEIDTRKRDKRQESETSQSDEPVLNRHCNMGRKANISEGSQQEDDPVKSNRRGDKNHIKSTKDAETSQKRESSKNAGNPGRSGDNHGLDSKIEWSQDNPYNVIERLQEQKMHLGEELTMANAKITSLIQFELEKVTEISDTSKNEVESTQKEEEQAKREEEWIAIDRGISRLRRQGSKITEQEERRGGQEIEIRAGSNRFQALLAWEEDKKDAINVETKKRGKEKNQAKEGVPRKIQEGGKGEGEDNHGQQKGERTGEEKTDQRETTQHTKEARKIEELQQEEEYNMDAESGSDESQREIRLVITKGEPGFLPRSKNSSGKLFPKDASTRPTLRIRERSSAIVAR